jgi:predicted nucleic acid-binding protein
VAEQYQRPYVESSVFIGHIKNEVIDGIDRGRIAQHIFALTVRGSFKLFTSSITLAEVHKPRGATRLNDVEDNSILEFLERDFIELIDVDRSIGEAANRLCRDQGLDPIDAVHVVCALRARCDVVLTWDDRMLKAEVPGIRISQPEMLGQASLDDVRDTL